MACTAVEMLSSSGSAFASFRTNRTQSFSRRTARVSVRVHRTAGVTTALSSGGTIRGSRRAGSVRCNAEPEKKGTLSNLDKMLDIKPAPPVPPRAERKIVIPTEPASPVAKKGPSTKGDDEPPIDFSEKIIASLCYFLPLMDGLKYSKFLLIQYPQFGLLLLPIAPVAQFYYSLGFLNIAVFFGLYFGVGQNKQLSKFLRYNAMQAIVLDVLLILPDVVGTLFNGINGPPTGGPGLELKILFENTVFIFVYLCVAYGSFSALGGKSAKLPLVGEAAEMQSGGPPE
eukprot:CAMPEP_0198229388 /NCGR_PEP_ID=MMETSP1445-20131203/114097_1 /TAXON_ID=36898 /ORGANISM="Pyramimonas sp., Strain CCMP2087" /LENGTH=284 /DNA_ID=CAMNT_0043909845 /DNA_START=106 /DNA_END=960 /DNA_ORIENTATION=+